MRHFVIKFLLLIATLLCLPGWSFFKKSPECVHIYYDKSTDTNYNIGKVYATYLQNLLGHFPQYQQIVSPVELYKKGDLEKCKANFYIGSYFQNNIPADFLKDYAVTQKQFAWMGYNIWQLDESVFENIYGYNYSHITTLDRDHLDSNQQPSFFRFFQYKGETFEKFGQFVGKDRIFHAGFEVIALKKNEDINPTPSQVLSTTSHSVRIQESLPYILNNKNHFYIADIPFSYVHESDRYLIFADVLFDILKEEPRHTQKYALIRIEDVHPKTALPEMYKLAQVFKEESVPLNISLIPVFFDPLYRYDRNADEEFVPMTHQADFMRFIDHVKKQDTQFIWHGVTHQYGRVLNPHTGYTSDDFEFWDAVNNTAIAEDSTNYVLQRLQYGWEFLEQAEIEPVAWLTPHYQASALDYILFARVFPWNIGRVIYFEHTSEGLPLAERPKAALFEAQTFDSEKQTQFFENLKVQTFGSWNGQLYPYEIYGDIYGQRLFPEILGNPQPFESSHVVYPRSVDQILADAKRNKVLRDSWASLFFHPYLLTDWYNDGIGEYPGDARPLVRLIQGLKNLGYTFIDMKDFATKNRDLRPEPIYIEQGED